MDPDTERSNQETANGDIPTKGHDVIQPHDSYLTVDDLFGGSNRSDHRVIKGEDNG